MNAATMHMKKMMTNKGNIAGKEMYKYPAPKNNTIRTYPSMSDVALLPLLGMGG
jgi:hypothetical protein